MMNPEARNGRPCKYGQPQILFWIARHRRQTPRPSSFQLETQTPISYTSNRILLGLPAGEAAYTLIVFPCPKKCNQQRVTGRR